MPFTFYITVNKTHAHVLSRYLNIQHKFNKFEVGNTNVQTLFFSKAVLSQIADMVCNFPPLPKMITLSIQKGCIRVPLKRGKKVQHIQCDQY